MSTPAFEAPRVIALRDGHEADTHIDSWLELCADAPVPSYFQTPDWALSWWSTIGERPPAQVATWSGPRDRLEAVAAVHRHRERLHSRVPIQVSAWSLLGGGFGNADHLSPSFVPGRLGDVAGWLASLRRRRSVLLPSLDPEIAASLVPRIGTGSVIARTICPRISIGADDPVPPTLRKKVRYYRRRLESKGVTFEWVAPTTITTEIWDALFELHEDRWEYKTGQRPGHLRRRREFFGELQTRGDAQRGPCCVVARHEGTIIAVLFGFMFAGTFAYFQTGWDPEWAQLSLGTALVDVAIEMAAHHGATTFDFLRGIDAYKYRFGAVDRVDETWLLPMGPAGALLRWKYTTGRDVARRAANVR